MTSVLAFWLVIGGTVVACAGGLIEMFTRQDSQIRAVVARMADAGPVDERGRLVYGHYRASQVYTTIAVKNSLDEAVNYIFDYKAGFLAGIEGIVINERDGFYYVRGPIPSGQSWNPWLDTSWRTTVAGVTGPWFFSAAYDTRAQAEAVAQSAPRYMPVDLPADFEVRPHGPDRWAVWMRYR